MISCAVMFGVQLRLSTSCRRSLPSDIEGKSVTDRDSSLGGWKGYFPSRWISNSLLVISTVITIPNAVGR